MPSLLLENQGKHPWWLKAWGLLAIGFGLLSLKAGGTVLFGGSEAEAAAGDYVPFVLWFNFLAGFLYIATGAGLVWAQRWAIPIAFFLAGATVAVFAAFGVHIFMGHAYETRTVAAMTVRSLFWILTAFLSKKGIPHQTYNGLLDKK